jgi:citrate lyase subunit beta/citryl-CoA lyase
MNDNKWPVRSLLFVPAIRDDWVKKAIRSGPDAVILDVEDSVTPADKQRARTLLPREIAELKAASTLPVLRINAFAEGGVEDLAAGMCTDLYAVVLPKVSSAREIIELDRSLAYHEGRVGKPLGETVIYPLPETAEGLADAREIASASRRVRGIFSGINGGVSGDVARAFGLVATEGGAEQLYMHSKMVLDSRSAGAMHPIASIMAARISDLAGTEQMIVRAKHLGFSGVVLIHPSHVPIANRVMRPQQDEVVFYTRMLQAFAEAEKQGLGAVKFEDQMIDYAYLPVARDVIAEAESLAKRGIHG